jgi:hypothetical protein
MSEIFLLLSISKILLLRYWGGSDVNENSQRILKVHQATLHIRIERVTLNLYRIYLSVLYVGTCCVFVLLAPRASLPRPNPNVNVQYVR